MTRPPSSGFSFSSLFCSTRSSLSPSWFRSIRVRSCRVGSWSRTSTCTTRRPTRLASAAPYSSPMSSAVSPTSSPTRRAHSPRTSCSSASAPSKASRTDTATPRLALHASPVSARPLPPSPTRFVLTKSCPPPPPPTSSTSTGPSSSPHSRVTKPCTLRTAGSSSCSSPSVTRSCSRWSTGRPHSLPPHPTRPPSYLPAPSSGLSSSSGITTAYMCATRSGGLSSSSPCWPFWISRPRGSGCQSCCETRRRVRSRSCPRELTMSCSSCYPLDRIGSSSKPSST
mmetsp:Transcript_37438/g.84830  ORF Transcript_37438/g.84830 Transcript_37438/m.84830 type:complete len:283 (-) Transcript_37438:2228-3076(-)